MGEAGEAGAGKRWGFGLIGSGTIADFHAAAIRELPNARLIGVASRNPENARSFADRHGCASFGDNEALLASPEIDIVCVTTSSGSHFVCAAQAIRARKHVLVEKPMAMVAEEAAELMALAEQHGVMLGAISQRRFQDQYRLAKQAVDEGRLGQLLLIEALTPYYRSQAYYDSADWRGTLAEDGGALMNQGIHQIDLLLWFGGEMKSVVGKTATRTHRMEAEDLGLAIVTFENGAMGYVMSSTSISPGFSPIFKVFGEHGTIIVEGNTIAQWSVPGMGMPDFDEELLPEGASDPRSITHDNHRNQMEDFIRAAEEGRPPISTGRDGYNAVRLINAIYESSSTGREVHFGKEDG